MQNYDEIVTLLTKQKAELETRVSKIKADLTKPNRMSKDFAEQAVDAENDEVLDGLLKEGQEELNLINLALRKISEGKYGVCIDCNEPIPYERLLAIPYSEYCIDCLELREK